MTAIRDLRSDLGPPIRRARDVVVEDAADPAAPNTTIRRARVRVIYHVGWIERHLTHTEHEAADRLLISLEAVTGANEDQATVSGRMAPWQRGHPSARALQAASDLRDAEARVGLPTMVWLAVVIGQNKWPGGQDWPRLAGALKVLAEMWGME